MSPDNENINTGNNGGKQRMIAGILIFFLAVGLAGGGWWWYQTTKYISTDDARVSGTIVSVSAKLPGRVSEVLVKEGQQVQAGQVLARIDTREVAAQKAQAEAALAAAKARYEEVLAGSRPQEINQARAGVDQAKAGVDQAKANLENASKNNDRMQQLYNQGAISSSQRDNAETAYLVAKESLRAAQESANAAGQKLDLTIAGSRDETIKAAAAQVKQAEAALDAVNVTEDNTIITAPVSGSVALKSVNPGEVVAAGQPLFSVTDLNDVWVNARIEETKIGKVKIGQTVEYTVDGYPGRTFSGTIYDIGTAVNSVFSLIPTENSSGNFTKVTQRIPVKITLPQDTGFIFRPGMSAYIKISVN